MAGTTLPLLTATPSGADTDIFLVRKSGDTSDKKITGANLKAYVQTGYQTAAAAAAAYQPIDTELTAIASTTSAANKLPYYTGSGTATTTDLSAYGRSLIDDADAATARGTLGLGSIATQAASAVAITGGSISNTSVTGLANPTNGSDAATKDYVDTVAAGLSQKNSVILSTTAALTATYANGTAGVGATLTNSGAQAALTLDGVAAVAGQRVLIKDQAAPAQNGIYIVTNIGSGATNWILTRTVDFDTPSEVQEGAYTVVEKGASNAGTLWIETGAGPFTIGTTSITFTQLKVAPQTLAFTGDVTGTGSSSIALAIGANKVLDTMIRQSAGLSVIGNATNATGNVADITAATDVQVLRRSGTAIGFGQIALNSSAAVTGSLAGANGGTGVANTGKSITIGGNLSTVGAFALAMTLTAATAVTLPTAGTLATLAGTETLSGKTLTAPVISSIVNTGTLTLPTSNDTLVGRATTDTLNNKTITTTGVGANIINGTNAASDTYLAGDGAWKTIITSWVPYTPSFTGFGTVSNVDFYSRRVGDSLEIRGKFTIGTATAVEARVSLGFNGTNGNVNIDPNKMPTPQSGAITVCEFDRTGSSTTVWAWKVLADDAANGYVCFGLRSSGGSGLAKLNGSSIGNSGDNYVIGLASVPIQGW